MSANRARFIQLPDLQHGLDEPFDSTEALLGRQRKHRSDLGAVHAVLVDVGLACGGGFSRKVVRHAP